MKLQVRSSLFSDSHPSRFSILVMLLSATLSVTAWQRMVDPWTRMDVVEMSLDPEGANGVHAGAHADWLMD